MRSKKVILDTNLWISFLITKNYSFIDKFVENQKVTLIFSKELIQEFLTVATRPKFQKYFTDQDIQKLLRSFDNFAKIIETTSNIEICRDFKDNFLLNLAIDSKADFLVTGDNDLLELKKIEKTKILTIRELTERI
ncbi:putative toxin-antitoxin system toxin component, PIN family [Marinilabilia rubra]|uniref:Putative toxin-antitoxin system toxin component, PIN family n=1 Tax=Marinilabilia rubra TaxID=2162893 RepID=A0A2U2B9B2_9BACT|nr:putative toxin-antitoxin system toxin component, PIN family [Marinilabilia rubra]PWD99633.1 putative toxin-antitoxin system toxin component, PIN family [Marinilabilia rubra]